MKPVELEAGLAQADESPSFSYLEASPGAILENNGVQNFNQGGNMVDQVEEMIASRKQIGIRLIYTILCLIAFEILKLIIQITVLFQFVYLLITRDYSTPLRTFSNRLATYAYRIIRYATLNENQRPFPFSEFPSEMEKSEEPVRFD